MFFIFFCAHFELLQADPSAIFRATPNECANFERAPYVPLGLARVVGVAAAGSSGQECLG